MACSCAMKCSCKPETSTFIWIDWLQLTFIHCSWGQTWKWNNKTNGSRIIFSVGQFFSWKRTILPCPFYALLSSVKFGRLIFPKTAISECTDRSRGQTLICWSFSGITFVLTVHPKVWPFKCFPLFQMVWAICHSVAGWEWRCCHGFPQWSAGTGQEGWSECIPPEH